MKKLLNTKEAAQYLSISPNFIRALIAQQRFPFRNVSRGSKPIFRFDKKELDEWTNRLPGLRLDDLE